MCGDVFMECNNFDGGNCCNMESNHYGHDCERCNHFDNELFNQVMVEMNNDLEGQYMCDCVRYTMTDVDEVMDYMDMMCEHDTLNELTNEEFEETAEMLIERFDEEAGYFY